MRLDKNYLVKKGPYHIKSAGNLWLSIIPKPAVLQKKTTLKGKESKEIKEIQKKNIYFFKVKMKAFIFAVLAFACLFSGAQATKCLVYGDIAHANGGDSAFWNAFPSIQSQFNLMSCRRALGQPQDHVPAIQYCEYRTWFGFSSFFLWEF